MEMKMNNSDDIVKSLEGNACDVEYATDEEVIALGSAIIEENREAFEELAK